MVNMPDDHIVEVNLTDEEKKECRIMLTWIDKDLLEEKVRLKFYFEKPHKSVTLRKTND